MIKKTIFIVLVVGLSWLSCFNVDAGSAYSSASVVSEADKIQWFDAVTKGDVDEVKRLFRMDNRLLTVCTRDSYDALLLAICHGHNELVKYLLDCGADCEVPCPRGETALHKAVKAKNLHLVDLLLKKGVNFLARNTEGKLAVDLSVDKNITQLLINAAAKNSEL